MTNHSNTIPLASTSLSAKEKAALALLREYGDDLLNAIEDILLLSILNNNDIDDETRKSADLVAMFYKEVRRA